MCRRTATPHDTEEWTEELAAWGMPLGMDEPGADPDAPIPVWAENWAAIEWWITIPGFLKFNQSVCLGMDVMAVSADATLSERTTNPADYHRLKIIARTIAEELNCE